MRMQLSTFKNTFPMARFANIQRFAKVLNFEGAAENTKIKRH